jgi:serine protease Do
MNKFKTIVYSTLITILLVSIGFSYIYFKYINPNLNSSKTEVADTTSASAVPDFQDKDSHADTLAIKSKLNDKIYQSKQTIITETVKNVSPAVVGINVTKVKKYRDPFTADPLFRYFFGDRVYQQEVKALGSGVIISPDGYVITNDHVAGDATEVIVTMTDGSRHPAKIIGTDHATDICLLKIEGKDLPYVKMGNSDEILIGEWVIALGNPFGLFEINDKPTVTVGVVSATGMNLNAVNGRFYINMIQTDAAINTGNSGGPLVDVLGELIGMNTLIYSPNGGSGSVGVGFAIPVNKIKRIIKQLKKTGKVERDFWTGLKIQPIDERLAKYFNLNSAKGVIITSVAPNSPAQKAGLLVSDIIVGIDKFIVTDDNSIISILNQYFTGDTINVRVLRDGKLLNFKMKLEKLND